MLVGFSDGMFLLERAIAELLQLTELGPLLAGALPFADAILLVHHPRGEGCTALVEPGARIRPLVDPARDVGCRLLAGQTGGPLLELRRRRHIARGNVLGNAELVLELLLARSQRLLL